MPAQLSVPMLSGNENSLASQLFPVKCLLMRPPPVMSVFTPRTSSRGLMDVVLPWVDASPQSSHVICKVPPAALDSRELQFLVTQFDKGKAARDGLDAAHFKR